MSINYHTVKFLISAAKVPQLPPDQGIEIAFAGRSNAGKSSVLNALTNHRQMARASKTPGRTQLINLFSIDQHRRLVDLPGYGYAKVSAQMKQDWMETLGQYLEVRECLKGVVIVMDIRHPLKSTDQQLIEWANRCGMAVHCLLNKADKLKKSQQSSALLQVAKTLKPYKNTEITLQLFSALKKQGLDTLQQKLDNWYLYDNLIEAEDTTDEITNPD